MERQETTSDDAPHKFELEKDLMTNALVSCLEKDHSASNTARALVKVMPVLVMGTVALIQVLMTWAVWCYIQNNLVLSISGPILTAYEMFIGTNTTIPISLMESLCGRWEDLEMGEENHGALSRITMPDGSVYGPDENYSLFYYLKMPTRTWDYSRLSVNDRSVLDNILYAIHEGVSVNPLTSSGYSMLFVLMMTIWLFSLTGELRRFFHFACMIAHFALQKPEEGDALQFNKEEGTYKIKYLDGTACFVGLLCIISRLIVTVAMAFVGTAFLYYTTIKIDLILNALAIEFVLALDNIIFFASVSSLQQNFISSIDPVPYGLPSTCCDWLPTMTASVQKFLFSTGAISSNLVLALLIRSWQCQTFRKYFRMTAAICLFAGPTPGGQTNVLAPVPGFCDSLLGATCAPAVTPNATAQEHGLCVITDQTVAHRPTLQFYLDDPALFDGRLDMLGNKKSWVEWSEEGNPQLYEKDVWARGPYQDKMRKQCLQMYQTTGFVEDRLVDDDTGETMNGAPFYCARDSLFNAVFGQVGNFENGVAMEINMASIDKVFDLSHPAVVAAIDRCNQTRSLQHHPDWPSDASLISVATPKVEHSTQNTTHKQKGRAKKRKLGAAGVLALGDIKLSQN